MRELGAGPPAGLAARTKAILLTPKTEWPVIAVEPATVDGLFRGYVAILAAVPAVCGAIGGLGGGASLMGVTYRLPIGAVVATAVFGYLLTLIGVYLLAIVIDALAPRFGGTPNRVQAVKLAAYSGTASWIAGVFLLIPGLGWLTILGLYGLYLLYLGLPVLMRAPADRAMGYTVVTVIAAFLLSLLVGAITAPLVGLVVGATVMPESGAIGDAVTVPGLGRIDLGKLDEATRQIDATNRGVAAGRAPDPAALQALLPEAIDGYARAEISGSGASTPGGIGGATAEGVYRDGANSITLELTDLGAAGALAAMGGAFDVKSSKQTESGYERIGQVDGRMTAEEWDGAARRGKYNVLVGSRFMVAAEGSGVEMAALKRAVGSIGFDRLEAMAK